MTTPYLRTLAALAVGAAPRLTYRVPGRFEPLDLNAWDGDETWGEEVVNREPLEVRVPLSEPMPPAGPLDGPAPGDFLPPRRVPLGEVDPRIAPTAPSLQPLRFEPAPPAVGPAADAPPPPGRTAPRVFVSLVAPPPAERRLSAVEREAAEPGPLGPPLGPLGAPPGVPPPAPQPVPRPAAHRHVPPAPQPVPRPAAHRHVPPAPQPIPRPATRRLVPPPAPQPIPRPATHRSIPPPAPQRPEGPTAQAHDVRPRVLPGEARPVNVHIGRVEVRAVLTPPPAPPAPVPPPARSPAPDLEAYLRGPGATR